MTRLENCERPITERDIFNPKGSPLPCGKCPPCRNWREAFRAKLAARAAERNTR